MSLHLRIILAFVVIFYFLLIFHFVKKKMLSLKYTLLWLVAGIGMGIMVLFPGILNSLATITGIETPMYGLFVFGIFFIIIILMSLTAIASKQTERIKNLAQSNAVLEKRIRELETKLSTMEEI